jgi:hypothetical protein
MSPAAGPIRVATVAAVGFGGVVLPAVTLGAMAGRLASPGRAFLVTAVVTSAVAFFSGVLAEPLLRRWLARLRRDGQRTSSDLPRRRS